MKTCYMCDLPATSREHAPPACVFPEEKDLGLDLRKNLVTVPSCDLHNSHKSTDDEYFSAILLMNLGLNQIGLSQFSTKLMRAAMRRPNAYASFFKDRGPVAGGAGRALRIDRDRVDKCVEHIVRALFFHHFGSKWLLPVLSVMPSIFFDIREGQPSPHEPSKNLAALTSAYLQETEQTYVGNPSVFKYRVRHDPVESSYAFGGVFYEIFEVYSWSSKALPNTTV